jgi:hypothetical protein
VENKKCLILKNEMQDAGLSCDDGTYWEGGMIWLEKKNGGGKNEKLLLEYVLQEDTGR